jgi:hypothetical protein
MNRTTQPRRAGVKARPAFAPFFSLGRYYVWIGKVSETDLGLSLNGRLTAAPAQSFRLANESNVTEG